MAKTPNPPARRPNPTPTAGIPMVAAAQPASRPQKNVWGRFLSTYWWGGILLFAFSLLLYSNTLNHEYALDDGLVITINKYTKMGTKGIGKILSSDSFEGAIGDQVNLLAGGRYRPLSLVTFAIEWEYFGENPEVSHLINVLIYGLSIFLLFFLLHRYLFRARPDVAFFATLIFAVHPTHTEAIANIKGRDELLSFLFLTLTTIFAYRFYIHKSVLALVGASVCFFLGLLGKENGLVFPVLLPLTMFFFPPAGEKRGEWLADLKKYAMYSIPFWVLVVAYFGLRFGVTGIKLTGGDTDILNNPFDYASGLERAGTIIYVMLRYLALCFYPHPLTYDYGWQEITYHSLGSPYVWMSILIYGGALGFAVWKFRERNVFAWCVLFFLLSLALVSNVLINIGAFMGDRLVYQATLALGVGLAYLITFMDKDGEALSTPDPNPIRFAIPLLLLVVAGGFAAKTYARNPDWKNNQTLFLTDVTHAPKSAKTNKGAAEALLTLGRKDETAKDTVAGHKKYSEAVQWQRKAIALHPRYNDAWLDMGTAFYMMERYDSAEVYWKKAGEIQPSHSTYKQNWKLLAYPAMNRAIRMERKGLSDSARIYFERALYFDSTQATVWNSLGLLVSRTGDVAGSVAYFEKATRYGKDDFNYWYNLGGSAYTVGRYDVAEKAWTQTLRIKPDHIQTRQGLGAIAARKADDAKRAATNPPKP